jgi:hypothetical protein
MIPGKDERLGLRGCNSKFKIKTLFEGKKETAILLLPRLHLRAAKKQLTEPSWL